MNILKKIANIDNKPIVVLGLQKMMWRYMFMSESQTKLDSLKYGLLVAVGWMNVVTWFVAGFGEDTLMGKIEVLVQSYCYMGGLLVYQVSMMNPRLIFRILNRFQELYDYHMPILKYREIIVACQTESVAVFKVFFVTINFPIFGLLLAPVMKYAFEMIFKGDAVLSMPIRGAYPWTTESTTNFFITYALQILFFIFIGSMIVSNATTLIAMTIALVSLFKITQEQFRKIQDCSENALELLKVAIRSHQDSLDLLQMVEHVGRNTYFFIIFMSALAMSLGVLFILNAEDLMTTSMIMIVCLNLTFQLFLLCWYGQRVINEEEALYLVLYEEVQWLDQSARFRSAFLISLGRAQRIDKLTACGFADVSFETFNSVITTTFSYLAFLQTVLEKV